MFTWKVPEGGSAPLVFPSLDQNKIILKVSAINPAECPVYKYSSLYKSHQIY
jgi:hypothetical protein